MFLAFSLLLPKSTETIQEQKPFEQIGIILIKPRAVRRLHTRASRASGPKTSKNILTLLLVT